MSKSYLNKVELRDGNIILFHRPNAKKPIYHMRIHVRGLRDVCGNKVTYVQESTGEADLEEANRYAMDKYDDLRLRAKKKEPVKQLTFNDLYVMWWAEKNVNGWRQRLTQRGEKARTSALVGTKSTQSVTGSRTLAT